MSKPKIIIATTPIRPVPSDYPPVGSLAVLSALKRAGYSNSHFYNIDLIRPEFDKAIKHIVAEQPDILGISAVVSTAYEYTKKLSLEIKKVLPDTTIILGGNLGASAEIILRKTGCDFVVTNEGEKTMVDFIRLWETTPTKKEDYGQVKGLAFLDNNGKFILTPFATPLTANELYDVDWKILEDLDQLKYFIVPASKSPKLAVTDREDPKIIQIKKEDKNCALINTSKGCVARCTFCHRWDKGIRYIPVPILMKRIDELINKYNVGFLRMGDENFGTDKRWLSELLSELKKRNLLWRVGGMRVNCVSADIIEQMRDAGCVTILYGMESGSQKILDVMEKKTTVEQNKNAMKWMVEKNLSTVIQLVVGMPGESSETVAETANFLRYSAALTPRWDPNNVSVNFAQALPGTPLYEFGRKKGLIGQTLEDEEKYLLKISDRDARDGETTINFTDYPRLLLERWHYDLQSVGRFAFIKKFGMNAYMKILAKSDFFEETEDSGYFANPARQIEKASNGPAAKEELILESSATADVLHKKKDHSKFSMKNYPSIPWLILNRKFHVIQIFYPRLFMKFRFLSTFMVFVGAILKYGLSWIPQLLAAYAFWRFKKLFRRQVAVRPYTSLRKYLLDGSMGAVKTDAPAMELLRSGR